MFRFAPSPNEDIDISALRVALFNYIEAKKSDQRFIIRIEDTDRSKNAQGKDKEILDILTIFGIKFDEVLYQSTNIKFQQQLAAKILMDKNAFCCFCNPEDINVQEQYDDTCVNLQDSEVIDNENPFVVRIKKPKESISFTDEVQGEFSFTPKEIDSFVIAKKDNYPTYNFACAIDDMLQDIGCIIRDQKHIPNTPKQILIQRYLGYEKTIKYAHIPSISGDIPTIKELLEEGFLPSAITNYVLLEGNKTPKEIFSLDEAIKFFDLKNISKTPVKFDREKLKDINKEYIKECDDLLLSSYFNFKDKNIGKLAKLYTQEAATINEIKEKIDKILESKDSHESFDAEFQIIKAEAKKAPYFEDFDEYKAYLMQKTELKGENFSKPLEFLLKGSDLGPKPDELYPLIRSYLQEIVR